jgi:hypothetical protein
MVEILTLYSTRAESFVLLLDSILVDDSIILISMHTTTLEAATSGQ